MRCLLCLLLALLLPCSAQAESPRSVPDPPYDPGPDVRALFDNLLQENWEEGQAAVPEGPERVLSFDSTIQIKPDGAIEVTERISVLVLGNEIQRGIIREIPTIYSSGGRRVLVPMDRISVSQDGEPAEFMEYALKNGVGLRIGSPARFLDHGVHVYAISYRMQRQIGRFSEHDELYWNVNGNSWAFGIDEMSCRVLLPESVPPEQLRSEAYTGPYGSLGRDFAVEQLDNGLLFRTTRPLAPSEGLTVVAGFPKGIIAEPPATLRMRWWLESNGGWALGLLILAIVGIYYLASWIRVGRDPHEGLVLREERPLIGLSAASLRYIWKLDVDETLMTALILELAQNGVLRIEHHHHGAWKLHRLRDGVAGLRPEERAFIEAVYRGKYKQITLDSQNHHRFRSARLAVENSLVHELHHVYYEMNERQRQTGIVLSVSGFGIWLVCLALGLFFFSAADFFLLLLALFVLNFLFYALLPAYSELGRAVLDRIEGFRLAMTGGEDSLGQYEYADEVLSEKYLPYAVALGVNTQWSILLQHLRSEQDKAGAPGWYTDPAREFLSPQDLDYSRLARHLPRNLSRVYRRASLPPPPPPSSRSSGGGWGGGSTSSGSWGSSSGSGFSGGSSSGGGGFSGGGGGGGGGRGW
ncbi:MAG: DUF2207 domain-containing protein [bacterium]